MNSKETSSSRHDSLHPSLEPIETKFEQILFYETASFFYLVGSDKQETIYRMLKFDRRIVKPNSLEDIFTEDPLVYNKEELTDMLQMIHEGNKQSGGLIKITSAYGIIGLVKFLDCYYLTLITQRRKVGSIGGNDIYTIKATEVYPIKPREVSDSNTLSKLWRKINKKLNQTSAEIAESRYMGLFQFVDLTKDFFFSYEYDLTNSLQYNYMIRKSYHNHHSKKRDNNHMISNQIQDMFMWNHYQLDEFVHLLGKSHANAWILPIIHGSCQQRRFSILGRLVDIMLIARRSRHYAGTRYLKRGINVHGKVANDCEIEQIIQVDSGSYAKYTSLLQIRGSIPTYWSQETSVTQPKPPIIVSRIDPAYLATQEHFSDLIKRYNLPIIVLDLIKHEERRPREVIVGKEYRQALEVVNSSLPLSHQIRYIGLDYSRLSKSAKHAASNNAGSKMISSSSSHDNQALSSSSGVTAPNQVATIGREWALLVKQQKSQQQPSSYDDNVDHIPSNDTQPSSSSYSRVDLFAELEHIATYSLSETAFFCSTSTYRHRLSSIIPSHKHHHHHHHHHHKVDDDDTHDVLLQHGVLRTNCIDCLDRTNGGQFALGMQHLTLGLCALGLKDDAGIDPSSKLFLELMEMYGELGDRIAVQYGGSEAHNKMAGASSSSSSSSSSMPSSSSSSGNNHPSSKQGELLTSIKRYYSNAFTDMVKQDAMNIFLGCFIPHQHAVPLWDLDSDYDLHNRLLHPPDPYVNHILFQEIPDDVKILSSSNHHDNDDEKILLSYLPRYFIRSIHDDHNDEDHLLSSSDHNRSSIYAIGSYSSSHHIDNIRSSPYDEKMMIDANVIPDHIKQLIMRSEQRKMISCNIRPKVEDAFEHWWRDAMNSYHIRYHPSSSSSSSMISSSTKSTSFKMVRSPSYDHNLSSSSSSSSSCVPMIPYFDRAHNPHELTCFDDYFASDCHQTIDIISDHHSITHHNNHHHINDDDDDEDDDKLSSLPHTGSNIIARGLVGGIASLRSRSMYITSSSKKRTSLSSYDDHSRSSDMMIPPNNRPHKTIIDPDLYYSIINPQDYDYMSDMVSSSSSMKATMSPSSSSKSSSSYTHDISSSSSSSSSMQHHQRDSMMTNDDHISSSYQPTNNNSGFFGKYVREIGMKARFFVGGLLRRDGEEVTNVIIDDKTSYDDISSSTAALLDRGTSYDYHHLYDHISSSSSSSSMNVFKPVTSKTISQYAVYAAQHDDPTKMMINGVFDDTSSSSSSMKANHHIYSEFALNLHDMMISCDDVSGIEALSHDHHINTTLRCNNIYHDLSHLDSAELATGVLYTALDHIEAELQDNLDELLINTHHHHTSSSLSHHQPSIASPEPSSSSSSSSVMIAEESTVIYGDMMPVTTSTSDQHIITSPDAMINQPILPTNTPSSSPKASSSSSYHNGLPYEKALSMKSTTKDHIASYCDHMKISSSSGLASAIYHHSQRYLFEQVVLYRDIDDHRMMKRMSTLSSSKTIIDYANMFSRELVAIDMDHFTFIASDSPLFSSLYDVDMLRLSLRNIYDQLQDTRHHLYPSSTLSSSSSLKKRIDNDDVISDDKHDYDGFVCKAPDVYVRRTNPYLIVNEAAASSYSMTSSSLVQ